MKNSRRNTSFRLNTGFTLLEMIGVMAIMAILASVLVPNLLKTMENAAVRAEAETLRNLGEQAKLYLRDNAVQPTTANWSTALGTYASLNPLDILTNKRAMTRIYVQDPAAPNERAMIVSSMRQGVALPSAATMAGSFSTIWGWTFDPVLRPQPPTFNAAAWTGTITESYLVIERINFASIYRTDLARYAVRLNNTSLVKSVSYRVVSATGTLSIATDIAARPGPLPAEVSLGSKESLNLYFGAGGVAANLDYVHKGGTTTKSFSYVDNADGTNGRWLPITP